MGKVTMMLAIALVILHLVSRCRGGVTSSYRRKLEASVDMPLNSDVFRRPPGYNAPEQVHITQGDYVGRGVIVSWVTPVEPGSDLVLYGPASNKSKYQAHARLTTYKFGNYTSGYIHHCKLKNLDYNTLYYYRVGIGNSSREFSFTTPPEVGPDVPYTFGIIGDLGQTFDSNQTLGHYASNELAKALLFVGDLSYADHYPLHDNRRWDSWGRFVERVAAYQPWILTAGNHEIDTVPEIHETTPFKPYIHRYHAPFKASGSTSPLWYSIKRASAHIIVLSSYSAYAKYTPQYEWLQNEFTKVNRSETPWLIVLVHSPWYNSNNYHYMEGETMRVIFESWFVQNKVDLVFSGHVHAYERSERISNIAYNITNKECTPIPDPSAPVYITIGDGGNIEGLANNFTEPQPNYSAYREASFGHATLEIKNRTHAYYSWHRNSDGIKEVGDSAWIYNRYWRPDE
ncbi:purple acid phosphatase 2-like [Ananas comosus]|uniref:Purple acid phosphatase n=1 Tax=Ananas comosus TaxID=4615 RepID=A0A6P5G110_ANACO|nr:purple acid phosphatase 2-like [Ananas comosus]